MNQARYAPAQQKDQGDHAARETRTLAITRETPVACPACGKRVKRKSRSQVYCSTKCRERAHYAKSVRQGDFNPRRL